MTIAEITATLKNGVLANCFVEFYGNFSDDYIYQYSRQVLENMMGSKIDDKYTKYMRINGRTIHFNGEPSWNINTIAVKLMNLLLKLQ